MLHDRFIQLVTKSLANTTTVAEEYELRQLLLQPDYRQRYEILKKFWSGDAFTSPDTEGALQHIMANLASSEAPRVRTAEKNRRVKWAAFSMATLALLAGIAWWSLRVPPSNTERNVAVTNSDTSSVIEKQNLKGTRSVIALADGSKVWLNADSRLKYPAIFTGNTREIELSGEAFFEVTKNPQKPFIINLANGTVKVLGTSFNIKAYPGENKIETSVATGRVAFVPKIVKGRKGSDTTFLTKNLKAVYSIESGVVTTIKTSSALDKAWTDGKLIFYANSMEEIGLALERSFGKEVVINDDEIRQYRLTGSFENNSVEEILYYLSKTKPFTYRITESQIIISLVR